MALDRRALPGALGEHRAAVPADVDERTQRALVVAGHDDRDAAGVGREERSGFGHLVGTAAVLPAAREDPRSLAPQQPLVDVPRERQGLGTACDRHAPMLQAYRPSPGMGSRPAARSTIRVEEMALPKLSTVCLGVAFALLGGVAAGCGVDVSAAVDPVASAATKTQSAGTARLAFVATFGSGGKTFTLTGDGAVGPGQADVSLNLASFLSRLGAPAGTDPEAREIFLEEDGDYVGYLKLGLLGPLPGGAHWLRIDFSKIGKHAGVDVSKLLGTGMTQDPAQLLSTLRATSGDVVTVGAETIDGARTTHYRANVDLAKAAKLRGVSTQGVATLLAAGAPTTVPEDVWVGRDGLVRRLRLAYSLDTNGVPAHMTMTIDLSRYGDPQNAIAPPPSADVFDASGLFK